LTTTTTQLVEQARILVVDDNESLRRTLDLILIKNGYEVDTANCGCDAIEKVRSINYNVVLLDLKLPDIDGTELLNRFTELNPDMAVIIMTGHASIESAVKALKCDVEGYITKPVEMDEVITAINTVLVKQHLIKEKLHTEYALRESEEKYRTLFENTPNALVLIEAVLNETGAIVDYIILDVNDAFENYAGIGKSNLINRKMSEVFPGNEESVSEWIEVLTEIARIGGSTNYERYFAPLKKWFSVTIYSPEVNRFVTVLVDITERKHTEEALRESEEKYRLLFENTAEGVAVTDENGTLILCNHRLAEMFGYSIDEVLGRNFISYIHPEDIERISNEITDTIQNADITPPTTEVRGIRKDGSSLWFRARSTTIIEDGEYKGFHTLIWDVTEEKKAEDDLRTAAETAMLYLDLMGHDLRNHMQSISMGMDILKHGNHEAEFETVYELVVESVDGAQNLIDKIHSTRELLSTSVGYVDLGKILQEAIEAIRIEYDDVQVHATLENSCPSVCGNKFLSNLLINLLENAIVHNMNEIRHVWIEVVETADGCSVIISDNGPGVPDDKKEALFDPHRRFGGVGIHQSLKIAQRFGGKIEIRDRVNGDYNQGAEFCVWLPKGNGALDKELEG
jgi:PAS domain S-box-containing protein